MQRPPPITRKSHLCSKENKLAESLFCPLIARYVRTVKEGRYEPVERVPYESKLEHLLELIHGVPKVRN